MSNTRFPELGFSALPGHTKTPADILAEVTHADRLGIGSAWISERFDVKEAGVLAGAAGAVTKDIFIGTAATNINTRHPLVRASLASTMHRLTHGRFALGVARGVGVRSDLSGIGRVSNQHLRDFAEMMRSLWRGQRVMGYDGPLGNYPYLHMNGLDEDIPLAFCCYGPRSLEFAGSIFDAVILTTFLSDAAVTRAVNLVRQGAEKAGRDPSHVKVWSVLATAHEPDEETRLRYLIARIGTYMQAPDLGDMYVEINDWDPAVLQRFRENETVANMMGGIDSVATLEQLREIETLVPPEYLYAACGDAATCAQRWQDQFKAGADGVIIHASTPQEFEPVLYAYEKIRDNDRFRNRTNRPG